MGKWIAEFDLEEGSTMPEHMDLNYMGGKIDFHCRPMWIPCSERLPEDRNLVLVTAYWHETYQVMMASYYGDGLWWCVPFNNCGEHMQKRNIKL